MPPPISWLARTACKPDIARRETSVITGKGFSILRSLQRFVEKSSNSAALARTRTSATPGAKHALEGHRQVRRELPRALLDWRYFRRLAGRERRRGSLRGTPRKASSRVVVSHSPKTRHECHSNGQPAKAPRPPKLFRAYLNISARLCGPPAIEREFKTIDFLTLVDLQRINIQISAEQLRRARSFCRLAVRMALMPG